LQNFSIKTKLLINLFFSVSIIIIIGLITYMNLQKLDYFQNELNEEYNRAQLAIQVSTSGEKLYSIIADSYIYGDIGNMQQEFTTEKEDTKNNIESLSENASKAHQTLLHNAMTEYYKIVAAYEFSILPHLEILSTEPDNRLSQAHVANYLNDLKEYMEPYKRYLNTVANEMVAKAEIQKANFEETSKSIVMINIILIIAGTFFIFLIAFFIMRSIISPLNKAVSFVNNISKWDMSSKITVKNKDEIGILLNAMQNMSDNITERISAINEISSGNLNVHVPKASEKDELAESINKVVSSLKGLIDETESLVDNSVKGKLDVRGKASQYEGAYGAIVSSINKIIDTLVGHMNAVQAPIMIIDKDFEIQYMNTAGADLTGLSGDELIGKKCFDCMKTSDCNTSKCAAGIAMTENRIASSETDAHPGSHDLDISYDGIPLKNNDGEIIGSLEIITDLTEIKKAQRVSEKQIKLQEREVSALISNLELLAQGNLNLELEPSETDDDTKQLGENFDKIKENLGISIDAIKTYVIEISDVLTKIANSDLNIEITSDYMGDFSSIKAALNLIIQSFNEVLQEINNSADQVATGAHQLSDSSQELSQGATEQAGAIEQLTVSIKEIAQKTKQNAGYAENANQLTGTVKENANKGNLHMQEMLSSMKEINVASSNISNIIKVIDEIAFQTNILALNAAVEAARAGEHGKGFAVVAEEVRNLAARSAQAAKETTELIEGSISKAQSGTETANATAEALNEIIEGVTKAAELVGQIAQSSIGQTSGIEEIEGGIQQVSEVTQTNTSTAEESAAATEELSGQAELLKEMVSKFNLKDTYKLNSLNDESVELLTASGTVCEKEDRDETMLDDSDCLNNSDDIEEETETDDCGKY